MRMSTYLDKLIESVKHELEREHARLQRVTFHQRAAERRETGTLKLLEQRLAVLEHLKADEGRRKVSDLPYRHADT